jgi:putative endonuclease
MVVPAKAGTQLSRIPAKVGVGRHPREGGEADPICLGVNPSACKRVARRVKQPVVYLLASKPYGTLYIGVTSNLADRVEAHRNGCVDGFTKQYGVHTLVYFEVHAGMYEAIQREKRLKKWNRAWKIRLIEEMNPEWKDLSEQAF